MAIEEALWRSRRNALAANVIAEDDADMKKTQNYTMPATSQKGSRA
jgi:hypothetical protein